MQIIALFAVLVFAAAVFLLSGLVGFLVAGITATFIRSATLRRRLVMSATSALPFFCLSIVVIPFFLERAIVEKLNVPGSCGLPNGFSLMVADGGGPGLVYDARKDFDKGGINWRKDAVDGVEELQVAGRYVFGGRNSHGLAVGKEQVDSYFALDTKTGQKSTISSLSQLRSTASQLGIHLELERTYTVYLRYSEFVREPQFGRVLLSFVLVGLLWRWILQLQRFRSFDSASLTPS